MSQVEILNYLKDNPNTWFDSHQITTGIGLSANVFQRLQRLRKYGEVNWKRVREGSVLKYLYRHKAPVT